MKNSLKVFSVLLVLCMVCGVAFAGWISPTNDVTKKLVLTPKGGLLGTGTATSVNNSTTVSGRGESITGILVTTGSTIGVSGSNIGLFDSPVYWNGTSYQQYDVPNECVFEAYVAPNTTTFFDLHYSPITTSQGLYVTQSSAYSNVIVYTQQ